MARGDNLKPYQFKPGQSGNPAGRPPGSLSIVAEIKRQVGRDPELLEDLVRGWLERARSGDKDAVALKAFMTFIDRVDGAVVKQHKVTGDVSLSKLVQLEGDAGDPEAGEDAVEASDGGDDQ